MASFVRFAFSIGTAALCAGCVPGQTRNEMQPPIGLPQNRAAYADRGRSWMADKAGSDLLYVPNTTYVDVFRYQRPHLVGTLQGFNDIVAACSDSKGNAYFVDEASENVYEFAHGGTTPIATFQDAPYDPLDCSVDPLTGDLAVANGGKEGGGDGNIAIFSSATGKPKFYVRPLRTYSGCAYDDQGNLLATNGADINEGESGFAWFAAGTSRPTRIKLRGSGLDGVGPIRFDGKYFVIFSSRSELTQVLVQNGHGKVVGVTKLAGHGIRGGYAIYRRSGSGQGTQVVGVYNSRSSFAAGEVEYWKYPAGGYVFATITGRSLEPTGVAISLKQ